MSDHAPSIRHYYSDVDFERIERSFRPNAGFNATTFRAELEQAADFYFGWSRGEPDNEPKLSDIRRRLTSLGVALDKLISDRGDDSAAERNDRNRSRRIARGHE